MILTSQPITVGGVEVVETTVNLVLQTQLGPDGSKTTAHINGQRFIRDGQATLPVGTPIAKHYGDVFAVASANPAIGAEVQIIMESLGRLAPLLGL